VTAFELAIQDAEGVAVARTVRPDRVELAAALSTGGLTPSIGLIEAAVDAGLEVHVLVRPRLGDFAYTAAERALLVADARAALAAGAAGIVSGGTRHGAIDADVVTALLDIAGRAEVTFHRAFDTVADRHAALDVLVGAGVTRVLTSGGAPRADAALPELRALVSRAAGAIQVMAGAGIDASNASVIARTGVDAIHASAKRRVVGAASVPLGSDPHAGSGDHETTDAAVATAIRYALSA
jgi:copper homeostasis protein